MRLLYTIFTGIFPLIMWLAAPFNPRARLWITGRKNVFQELENAISASDKVIWMHCASLGEFEQGRPVIESIRQHRSNYKILITFFSPSGYTVQKNYEEADAVVYLPMDSFHNARKFFSIVHPTLILFVKYEFWYYYLAEARNRQIPLLLISGIFRPKQPFFSWYGTLHRQMLQSFFHFFVQNQASADLLKSIGICTKVTVTGDTRVDRVLDIAKRVTEAPLITQFCGNADVIVAGSTWNDDDEELDHFANTHSELRFIIAPHNIGRERLDDCCKLYRKAMLYSSLAEANGQMPESINTLIIDNVGMLSMLYKYATVCYVGGGFGKEGVHNILEAAVYGKPVIFGPVYEKFVEADELITEGGAFSITNALELERILQKMLLKEDDYTRASKAAASYVNRKKGATEAIVSFIHENRLLTN